jgi:hypothetical protein
MNFVLQILDLEMILDFIYVYQYYLKKNQPKISLTILILKYLYKSLNCVTCIFLLQIYFIHLIFSIFVGFIKINLNLRLIKYI